MPYDGFDFLISVLAVLAMIYAIWDNTRGP